MISKAHATPATPTEGTPSVVDAGGYASACVTVIVAPANAGTSAPPSVAESAYVPTTVGRNVRSYVPSLLSPSRATSSRLRFAPSESNVARARYVSAPRAAEYAASFPNASRDVKRNTAGEPARTVFGVSRTRASSATGASRDGATATRTTPRDASPISGQFPPAGSYAPAPPASMKMAYSPATVALNVSAIRP